MTAINANTTSLNILNHFRRTNDSLSTSLERLSSGQKINRASDDPAGMVVSEFLTSNIQGLNQAVSNAERASNLLSTAEGGLSEVSSQLNTLRSLVLDSMNSGALSSDEIAANQVQIDSTLSAINRIADQTTFGSLHLLDGTLDFNTSNYTAARVESAKVYQGQQSDGDNVTGDGVTVQGAVTASARQAWLVSLNDFTLGAGETMSIRVTGDRGSKVITLGQGSTRQTLGRQINASWKETGVYYNQADTSIRSVEFGSDQTVTVEEIADPTNKFTINSYYDDNQAAQAFTNAATRKVFSDTGRDVAGTIDGITAQGKGRTLSVSTSDLQAQMTMAYSEMYAGNTGSTNEWAFTYDDNGGAKFSIGKDASSLDQVVLGILRIDSDSIGRGNQVKLVLDANNDWTSTTSSSANLMNLASGQAYDMETNPSAALTIVDKAISDVTLTRARLGAFASETLEPSISSFTTTAENLAKSVSTIRDTDLAAETSNLVRQQILVSTGAYALRSAQLAPQTVLSLLMGSGK